VRHSTEHLGPTSGPWKAFAQCFGWSQYGTVFAVHVPHRGRGWPKGHWWYLLQEPKSQSLSGDWPWRWAGVGRGGHLHARARELLLIVVVIGACNTGLAHT